MMVGVGNFGHGSKLWYERVTRADLPTDIGHGPWCPVDDALCTGFPQGSSSPCVAWGAPWQFTVLLAWATTALVAAGGTRFHVSGFDAQQTARWAARADDTR